VIFNRGRHSITVGGNLKRYRGNVAQNIWAGGVMSFTNFAGFYRSGAVQSTTSLGIPGTWDEEKGWRQTYWATYLQDDFRAMPSLTVNLGVRLERTSTPCTTTYLLSQPSISRMPRPGQFRSPIRWERYSPIRAASMWVPTFL